MCRLDDACLGEQGEGTSLRRRVIARQPRDEAHHRASVGERLVDQLCNVGIRHERQHLEHRDSFGWLLGQHHCEL